MPQIERVERLIGVRVGYRRHVTRRAERDCGNQVERAVIFSDALESVFIRRVVGVALDDIDRGATALTRQSAKFRL